MVFPPPGSERSPNQPSFLNHRQVEYHRPSQESIQEYNALLAESNLHAAKAEKHTLFVPSRQAPAPPQSSSVRSKTPPELSRSLVRNSLQKPKPRARKHSLTSATATAQIIEHDPFSANATTVDSLAQVVNRNGMLSSMTPPPRPSRANTVALDDLFSTPGVLAARRLSSPAEAVTEPSSEYINSSTFIPGKKSKNPFQTFESFFKRQKTTSDSKIFGLPSSFSIVGLDSLSEDQVVIAVMGPPGSGKTSFICTAIRGDHAFRRDLQSSNVNMVKVVFRSGLDVVFVEMPGFHDKNKPDRDILVTLADWLYETYRRKITLAGILYFHRITDTEMEQASLDNLCIFKELCGIHALKSVVLVTTMWDMLDEDTGIQQEKELRDTHWKAMIDQGLSTARYRGTLESAWDILNHSIQDRNHRFDVLLQRELVDTKLFKTYAGLELSRLLESRIISHHDTLRRLRTEIKHYQDVQTADVLTAVCKRIQKEMNVATSELRTLGLPLSQRLISMARVPSAGAVAKDQKKPDVAMTKRYGKHYIARGDDVHEADWEKEVSGNVQSQLATFTQELPINGNEFRLREEELQKREQAQQREQDAIRKEVERLQAREAAIVQQVTSTQELLEIKEDELRLREDRLQEREQAQQQEQHTIRMEVKRIQAREADVVRQAMSMQDLQIKGDELRLREQELQKGEQEVQQRKQDTIRKEVERLQAREAAVIRRVTSVLQDVDRYKRFLSCLEPQAQILLDFFQVRLDNPPDIKPDIRRSLVIAMQGLARKNDIFPKHFTLQGVTVLANDPVVVGHFADIYKGRFNRDRVVCLKMIKVSEMEGIVKRFSQEAILWDQLSHPNLLPFYGLSRLRGRVCLVSPWIDNGHVNQYIERNPDVDRILLSLDTAQGIQHLHNKDIIHGDLKGANVLVNAAGRACVADFGLSSVTDANIAYWASQSAVGSKGGTTRWQAPELNDPENDNIVLNTKASDVYAYSCVCYEIFTGRLPFYEVPRDSTVMHRVSHGQRPSRPSMTDPAWVNWGLTEAIWVLMEDGWEHNGADRPIIENIIARLVSEERADNRPPGNWASDMSPSYFRNSVSEQNSPSLDDVELILSEFA